MRQRYDYFFERLLVDLMSWRFLAGGGGEAGEAGDSIADACRFGGQPGFLGETAGATWPGAGVDASDVGGLAGGRPVFLVVGARSAVTGAGACVGAGTEARSRINALATADGRPCRGR